MHCATAVVRARLHGAAKPEWGDDAAKERPDKKTGYPCNRTRLISGNNLALKYVSRDTAMASPFL
jgi:hypothetical protein